MIVRGLWYQGHVIYGSVERLHRRLWVRNDGRKYHEVSEQDFYRVVEYILCT